MTDTPDLDLAALRAGFAGEILTAGDRERYDEARAVFNAMFDRRPAAIAKATCDDDVIAAILFARSARVPMAIRAGGHSVAGYSSSEGGLLLDLRPMKSIEVNPAGRTVRCGPGVLLIFNAKETVVPPPPQAFPVPVHGAAGPGHACFRVAGPALDFWAKKLEEAGIAIEADFRWPNGARSLYFRDPAGNSLECAEPGLWNIA